MAIEQLVVDVDNRPGQLAAVINLLAENCINIHALSLAEQSTAGKLRMIVNDTGKAKQVIGDHGFPVKVSQVVVIEVPDKPGGLASVLDTLKRESLNVEYMYAFSQKCGESGLLIFRFDKTDAAIEALLQAGFRVLASEDLYAL